MSSTAGCGIGWGSASASRAVAGIVAFAATMARTVGVGPASGSPGRPVVPAGVRRARQTDGALCDVGRSADAPEEQRSFPTSLEPIRRFDTTATHIGGRRTRNGPLPPVRPWPDHFPGPGTPGRGAPTAGRQA